MDIPPLNRSAPVVTHNLTASNSFAIYWANVIAAIKAQIADIVSINTEQTNLLNQILAVQASSNAANAALNSINLGFPSGTSGPSVFGVSSTSWVTVGSVDLMGVTAGTLRFDTTRLLVDGINTDITGSPTLLADYQITEEPTGGGSVTVCLSGSWTATKDFVSGLVEIDFPVATVDAARPTMVNTGNVTYRLQVRRASGSNSLANAVAIFRAAKAT